MTEMAAPIGGMPSTSNSPSVNFPSVTIRVALVGTRTLLPSESITVLSDV